MNNFIIIILVFSIGCSKTNSLIGHWHLSRVLDEPKERREVMFSSLDIINDTLLYIGRNSIYGLTIGKLNNKTNRFVFPGDCGSLDFKYKFNNNSIYLENHLGEKYIGNKCDGDCCDKIEDYQRNLKLNIEIPINNNLKPIKIDPLKFYRINIECIFLGFRKAKSKNDIDSLILEISGELKELNNLESWIVMQNSKYPKNQRKYINWIIYADKNVSISELNLILSILHKKGMKNILIASLKKNYQEGFFIFDYIPEQEIKIGYNIKLQDAFN